MRRLTSRKEITAAEERLVTRLRDSAAYTREQLLGFRSGSRTRPTSWLPAANLWFAHDQLDTRYWNAFGLGEPDPERPQSIVVQINPPYKGAGRRSAGAFLTDDTGRTYLAHTGKVGGGRKGIGKQEFLERYAGPRVEADGREYLLVADLKADSLVADIASFVRAVAEFKDWAVSGIEDEEDEGQYWAGGFSEQERLQQFIAGKYWQINWGRNEEHRAAQRTWRRFAEVNVGDWLAIKGYGGRHDLVVHYIGEVTAIDRDAGRVELTDLDYGEYYHGKAPGGPGAGNWHDTLVPVTRPDIIEMIFQPYESEDEDEPDDPGDARDQGPVPQASNIILYGPPGTGKTYRLLDEYMDQYRDPDDVGVDAERVNDSARQTLVTFHQSFAYEDFIEGIRPRVQRYGLPAEHEDTGEGADGVRYILEDGIFKRAVHEAITCAGFSGTIDEFCRLPASKRHTYLVGADRCALFVDEINRGNISQIFGELITLLEPDKRLGAAHELIVTLPYSKELFGVPCNLDLIGTMNTADRSIEALDTALRRRFEFVECPPDYDLLGFEVEGVHVGRLLEAINRRLVRLYDRDHLIGHAYFMALEHEPRLEHLKSIFASRIIPLLQEYFFSDWGRIGLILGKSFVTVDADLSTPFADFPHDDAEVLGDDTTYRLIPLDTLDAAAFRSIYGHGTDDQTV